MPLIYSADEVLQRGLELVNVLAAKQARCKRSSNVERFKAEYGADPAVYAQIWEDLQITHIDDARIDSKECTLDNFFIALNFLKQYQSLIQQSNKFGPCKNTIMKWNWYFVVRIQALKQVKITWPKEWNKNNPAPPGLLFIPIPLLTVDGVHARRNEVTHFKWSKNPKYYSHKFKTAAVNYEIAIHLFESRVVHIRGPTPASKPDITIFRQELLGKIPDGHLAIGDKGYLGESEKLMTPNSHDSAEVRKFKGRARARHETFNKKLKRFECIDKRFVHGEDEQAMCFEAVLVICQYDMEMGSPLFDI